MSSGDAAFCTFRRELFSSIIGRYGTAIMHSKLKSSAPTPKIIKYTYTFNICIDISRSKLYNYFVRLRQCTKAANFNVKCLILNEKKLF